MEFIYNASFRLNFIIRITIKSVESSSNRIDRISSSFNRGWFEMVLELLFEYGEHESSSVAQILNVVRLNNTGQVWLS